MACLRIYSQLMWLVIDATVKLASSSIEQSVKTVISQSEGNTIKMAIVIRPSARAKPAVESWATH